MGERSHRCIYNPVHLYQVLKVELTGVEPVSALAIGSLLIHRLSFVDPRSGDRLLSQTMGCSGKGLCYADDQRQPASRIRWGLSIVLNGVKLQMLKPRSGFF